MGRDESAAHEVREAVESEELPRFAGRIKPGSTSHREGVAAPEDDQLIRVASGLCRCLSGTTDRDGRMWAASVRRRGGADRAAAKRSGTG